MQKLERWLTAHCGKAQNRFQRYVFKTFLYKDIILCFQCKHVTPHVMTEMLNKYEEVSCLSTKQSISSCILTNAHQRILTALPRGMGSLF